MSSSLIAITFDCRDAAAQAAFWSGVLDRAVDPDPSEAFASIGLPDAGPASPALMFIAVPEGKTAKNRCHPDLLSATLDDEVARVGELGATKLADITEGSTHWVTLADPEGNEFDIVAG